MTQPRLLALLLVISPVVARADLRLTAAVTLDTEKTAAGAPAASASRTTKSYTIDAVIGADYWTYTTPERVTHADFAARKLYYLDREKKTYLATSIYSDLGFRVAELSNRTMLQKGMAAAGLKERLFDGVLIEHLFALRGPDTRPLSPEANTSERLVYTHGAQPLMSCSLKGHSLDAAEAAQFVRFLRYIFPMHPDILAALQERKRVPDELEVYRYNVAVEHYRIVVTKVEVAPAAFDRATALAGYQPVANELAQLCSGRSRMSAAEFQHQCRQLLDSAVIDGETKLYLDSLLATLAYGLSQGEQQLEMMRRFKDGFRTDPQCTAVLGAINPKAKEAAIKAADVLHTLEPRTKHPEVLQIFAANDLTMANRYEDAIKLFKAALQANPCITGAWKDLGDLYYMKFDAVSAWACWDTGRLFLPAHPQFKPVNEFEQKLLREHPEFY